MNQYILTFSDISERVKNEKQMARRSNGHFALMFLDLDKFKPVNDTHGHSVGDEPFRGHSIDIGTSVGIALYPDNGMTAADLMREADAAMYRVKAGGRNNLAYA
ncbi:GGDEF domain-containing protein [uncultured Marinobacter sp.]|uniref:diguanylate cyclase domain-containing protein n=1 Tax=uncultured Marinobacter sp. TaxID=187379 RepID=UPI0025837C10|nr:GGDEF domain-containing protein [uncultured Marinobacter sp.]